MKGSDTCILPKQSAVKGKTYNIGVRCVRQCKYSLRVYYAPVFSLGEKNLTQFRLEGHSTNIFEYYVPSSASDGVTAAISVQILGEDAYQFLDVYLSQDKDFYLTEELKEELILPKGKSYKLNKKSRDWCTLCFVNIIVNVRDPGRYYLKGQAEGNNEVVYAQRKKLYFMIKTNEQVCYSYFVD